MSSGRERAVRAFEMQAGERARRGSHSQLELPNERGRQTGAQMADAMADAIAVSCDAERAEEGCLGGVAWLHVTLTGTTGGAGLRNVRRRRATRRRAGTAGSQSAAAAARVAGGRRQRDGREGRTVELVCDRCLLVAACARGKRLTGWGMSRWATRSSLEESERGRADGWDDTRHLKH